MISKEMIISKDRYEARVAILEDSQVVEIYQEKVDKKSVTGNIYLGIVKDILPGMDAAFIDIGLERNALLFAEEVVYEEVDPTPRKIQQLLKEGQEIVVQVVKEPTATKGPRVTTQITLAGRYLVLMPFSNTVGVSRKLPDEEKERLREICSQIKLRGMGLIVRTVAEGVSRKELLKDLSYLRKLWESTRRKIRRSKPIKLIYEEPELVLRAIRDWFSTDFRTVVIDSLPQYKKIVAFSRKLSPEIKKKIRYYGEKYPLFDKYQVNEEIRKALRRKVWLKSGGYITIDPTEALTAIDVNTGKYVGKASLKKTVLKTNLEAAKEVVRQLRLRDIGGIIVVDFIDMEDRKDREEVFRLFNKELAKDRTKSRVIEISKIGLVEMTRKSTSTGLQRLMRESCPLCKGRGRIISDKTIAIDVERKIKRISLGRTSPALLFKLHSHTASLIKGDRSYNLRRIRKETGKKTYFLEEENYPQDGCDLIFEGSAKQVEGKLQESTKRKEGISTLIE